MTEPLVRARPVAPESHAHAWWRALTPVTWAAVVVGGLVLLWVLVFARGTSAGAAVDEPGEFIVTLLDGLTFAGSAVSIFLMRSRKTSDEGAHEALIPQIKEGIAYVRSETWIWVALVTLQPLLIRARRWTLHRAIGMAALPLAVAMAASGVGVGLYAVHRDLAAGAGESGYSALPGVLAAMAIFVLFVGIAIALRKHPAWHKRMIVLATIAILWPAWFRFRHLMPWLPRPEIWLALVLADSLILIAMLRDYLSFGRVHPAYWIFGSALVSEHVAEALLFDSPFWRAIAKAAYSALT